MAEPESWPERIRRAWRRFWYMDAEPANLGGFRIILALGVLCWFLFGATSSWSWAAELDANGPGFRYLQPIWYFEALGIRAQSPLLARVVYYGSLAAALCVLGGIGTRVSIAFLILAITYLKGARDSQAGDIHHRELMWVHALLILLFSRCGDALSLRARRIRGDPVAPGSACWPIRLVQTYIALFFFASGIAKIRLTGPEWMDGSLVQGLLVSRSMRWGADDPGIGWTIAQSPGLCAALAIATIVMELGFPLILFMRPNSKLQIVSLLGVTGFHFANAYLANVNFGFTPILFLVFLDLSAFWRRIAGPAPAAPGAG